MVAVAGNRLGNRCLWPFSAGAQGPFSSSENIFLQFLISELVWVFISLGNLYDDYHLKIYQFNVQEMYVFCIIYIPLEWDTLLKIVYLLYDIFFL